MTDPNSLPHMTNIKELVETGPIASAQARRAGGRAARMQVRTAARQALPGLHRQIPVYELLTAQGLELIHQASLGILQDVGIEFRDPQALALWAGAGAKVTDTRVRIPGELLMQLVGRIPSQFTIHARNPERSFKLGGNHAAFIPMHGARDVLGIDGVRQPANQLDLVQLHKLSHLAPEIHALSSGICEPSEIAAPHRHLHMLASAIRHSDKAFTGLAANRQQAEDTIAMARLVFGQEGLRKPVLVANVTGRSPLVWEAPALQAMTVFAQHGQPCIISPSALAGASTPASSAGAVAQVNAETLAGLAFTQLVAAGSPQVYGQYIVPVDMRSGAPMGGVPEAAQMTLLFGQLARRYKLAFRASAFHAGSKLADAQAGYEANMLMHAAILGGANVIAQAAGWIEAGQTVSYAKFMLDADQLGSWYKYAEGIHLDDLAAAMEAVRQVGPQGHFLGTAHTLANFQKAFYTPPLMDFSPLVQWEHEGSRDAATRGAQQAGWTLETYAAPELDPGIAQALDEFVTRRAQEIPTR
jgi:trimethylamine--corrinoid protein Co-methyltransferase